MLNTDQEIKDFLNDMYIRLLKKEIEELYLIHPSWLHEDFEKIKKAYEYHPTLIFNDPEAINKLENIIVAIVFKTLETINDLNGLEFVTPLKDEDLGYPDPHELFKTVPF